MQVRTTTIRRKNKTYRYAQLVESYRRDTDGLPTHRVVANLGRLPRQTVENLKLALSASRQGKVLVVADDCPGLSDTPKVKANLRYLDLAVMLEIWRACKLDTVLGQLLPQTAKGVLSIDIVTALVLHRCVAPSSKLKAQRWFPTTALGELLGIDAGQFNNTRLHRVLNEVHAATPELQRRLPALYQSQAQPANACFIDVTNTYFEGRGCEMAQRSQTKEGHRNKKTVGIVLVTDERGYPLRWQVVSSRAKDNTVMGEMAKQIANLDWIKAIPLVCDRAMGQESSIRALLQGKYHFLTAAPVTSIESYTGAIPHQLFTSLEFEDNEDSEDALKRDVQLAAQAARDTGLTEVDKELFVLELGVVKFEGARRGAKSAQRPLAVNPRGQQQDIAARLRLAQQFQEKLDRGEHKSQAAIGWAVGLSRSRVSQILRLLRLAPEIQAQILASEKPIHIPKSRLYEVLKEQDHSRQHALLADVLESLPPVNAKCDSGESGDELTPAEQISQSDDEQVRLVAYFNPQMMIEQRNRGQKHLSELYLFVEELNNELRQTSRSREEDPTRRKVMQKLERRNYVDLFELALEPIKVTTKTGGSLDSFQCRLTLKKSEWARRRRYDGFVLLVGHSSLKHSAVELAELYRAKDIIEKDFQKIKSVIKIRPIFHNTDLKVGAHVSLCMLALLLLRTVENRLKQANLALSASACFEILQTCHLNIMKQQITGGGVYSVTEPTVAQSEIIEALGLSHLTDDDSVARVLTPRVVSTESI